MAIFVTSDLHIGHDRSFLYEPRGFSNIDEHDVALVENWNAVVRPTDEVYILGDLMLMDNVHGMEVLRLLNGHHNIILGNHDTDTRIKLYKEYVIAEPVYATMIKHNGLRFYLSHYPTLTGNIEKESLKQTTICLHGHTHQQTNFTNDSPLMYHVGLDSHNNIPVLLDDIVAECIQKWRESREKGEI